MCRFPKIVEEAMKKEIVDLLKEQEKEIEAYVS